MSPFDELCDKPGLAYTSPSADQDGETVVSPGKIPYAVESRGKDPQLCRTPNKTSHEYSFLTNFTKVYFTKIELCKL
jgi:hypothetical protein